MEEVLEAVRASPWSPAELGRLECRKDHSFEAGRNGVAYRAKQVRLILVEGIAADYDADGRLRGFPI